MQALRLHEYGNLDYLKLEEIPDYQVGPGQVLVRNRASGVNPVDWKVALGHIQPPWSLPLVIGWDSAGIVAAIGAGVTQVQPGQRVMGFPNFVSAGAHAQWQLFRESEVIPIPDALTFAQAATLPVAGLTAWQSLFDVAKLQAGQAVLIHGAAGAVGLLAVQLAKQAGAYVVATASSPKHELVRALGADQLIDYRTTSFDTIVRGMDVVLDTVGGEVLAKSYSAVKAGGYLISTAHPPDARELEAHDIKGSMLELTPHAGTLTEIGRRAGAGEIRPVIDRTLAPAAYRDAYKYSMSQRAVGKIILSWE